MIATRYYRERGLLARTAALVAGVIELRRAREMAPLLIALVACTAAGAAIALRPSAAAVVCVAAALAMLCLRWRTGVIVLLLALPFAGVPAFVAGTPGLAARDAIIVAPLYVAFAMEMMRRGRRTREQALPPMTIAVTALAAFSAIVLVYMLRAPTPAAGAIGARVWLAYLPMLALGYVYVRRIADAERVLAMTALIALVPAGLAIFEAVHAHAHGDFGLLEGMYRNVALSDEGRFVVFTTGEGNVRIPRVPSTFTSVSQYFGFAIVAYSCALSMLFRRRNSGWLLVAAALATATVASGARMAYVAVPAITVLAIALVLAPVILRRASARPGIHAEQERPAAIATGGGAPKLWPFAPIPLIAVVTFIATHTSLGPIAAEIPSHIGVTLRTAFEEMGSAMRLAGHGTGWDTNAALRYGGASEGRYIENWYAKAALELGVFGLIAIAVALASMLWRLLRALLRADAASRALAAPIVAMLFVVVTSLFKGPYIDLDPLNVYFWLLAGVVAGVLMRRDGGENETR